LFLERWANLDVASGEVYQRRRRAFKRVFADLLPSHVARVVLPNEPTPTDSLVRQLVGDKEYFTWAEAQPMLRQIWKEPAPLLKKSGLMVLAAAYMREEGSGLIGWPPNRFMTVLLYALEHVHLLRYCANPECKEPYFVARRGSQIYCSSPCAEPAQREAKSKWWREHGDAQRKKSRKQRRKEHAKAKKA
jgi:hypothetical protein